MWYQTCYCGNVNFHFPAIDLFPGGLIKLSGLQNTFQFPRKWQLWNDCEQEGLCNTCHISYIKCWRLDSMSALPQKLLKMIDAMLNTGTHNTSLWCHGRAGSFFTIQVLTWVWYNIWHYGWAGIMTGFFTIQDQKVLTWVWNVHT